MYTLFKIDVSLIYQTQKTGTATGTLEAKWRSEMNIYFQTKKRDGQPTKRMYQLYAENMEQAVAEFSQHIISDIAKGTDYAFYSSEEDLNNDLPGYEWKGEGYYAMPNTETVRREDFYPKNARIRQYGEDVYYYGIEEVEDVVGGIGIN